MKATEKIVYVAYTRKSSESDERQVQSLDDQAAVVRGIAKTHGLTLKHVYEEARSGKDAFKRPAFTEMLQTIKKGAAQGIICWKLDRLARNPEEAGIIIGMLQRGEIKQIRTFEKVYLPEDNAVVSFVEFGIANQYSRDLSSNVKRGIKSKIEKGWRPGSAPHGYINTKTKNRGDNEVIPDPERFNDIRKAWHLLLAGSMTPIQILNWLNETRGFRTRTTHKTGGKPLSRSSIYRIFTNIFYAGQFEYAGEIYEGKHKRMITLEEYDRAQVILGTRGKPRVQKTQYAYTGIIKCGHCGSGLIGTYHRKLNKTKNEVTEYTMYFCERCRKNKVRPIRYVNSRKVDEAIERELHRITLHPALLEWALDILEERGHEQNADKRHVEESLEKALEAAKKRMARLLDGYSNGVIADDEYVSQKNVIKDEEMRIKEKLDALQTNEEGWIPLTRKTFHFSAYAHAAFLKGDAQTKREILLGLANLNSTIDGENVSIRPLEWFIPLQDYNPPLGAEFASLEPEVRRKQTTKEAFRPLSVSLRSGRDLNPQPPA